MIYSMRASLFYLSFLLVPMHGLGVDVQLHGKTTYTAGEPVILTLTVNNPSEQREIIYLGDSGYENISILLESSYDQIRRFDLPEDWGMSVPVQVELSESEEYSRMILLDEWIDISNPGKYRVVAEVEASSGYVLSGPFLLHVIESDESEISKVCARLAGVALGGVASKSLFAGRALLKTPVEACIPEMQKVAERNGPARSYAIASLAKIGTEAARKKLKKPWQDLDVMEKAEVLGLLAGDESAIQLLENLRQ